ncbi:Asp-tRNA(Asn)/Glu-tRNA(Gln) amidotransferase subunit GatC [Candidatus Saccharibacteria bacterium]|nr:Asp-tRNA(Asn)/Glu-tRNA(Gln) amidotransferase subunit GatC [Candidatus Saccharibacteria bacterium]
MTQISRDDVLKLATLSGLQLGDSEADGLQADIEAILGYVEQLNELNTDGVTPAYQVTGLQNVMRDDEIESGPVTRETLLSLAPDKKDNHIKVPKVL